MGVHKTWDSIAGSAESTLTLGRMDAKSYSSALVATLALGGVLFLLLRVLVRHLQSEKGMLKKILYLDQNALVDVIKNRDPAFAHAVQRFRQLGGRIVYAPPHIEEIANIYRSNASEPDCEKHVAEHLKGIRELTDCWEFLPNEEPNSPGRLLQEDPAECLDRVIDQYELTYVAEGNEQALRDLVLQNQVKPTPANAFSNAILHSIWKNRMWNRGFDPESYPTGNSLRDSFKATEGMIDICFRSLHDAGYGLEKKAKTRSAIHDVSHAIYATMADIFVSGDSRMLDKTTAVYRFLETDCEVLSKEDFISYVDSLQNN